MHWLSCQHKKNYSMYIIDYRYHSYKVRSGKHAIVILLVNDFEHDNRRAWRNYLKCIHACVGTISRKSGDCVIYIMWNVRHFTLSKIQRKWADSRSALLKSRISSGFFTRQCFFYYISIEKQQTTVVTQHLCNVVINTMRLYVETYSNNA